MRSWRFFAARVCNCSRSVQMRSSSLNRSREWKQTHLWQNRLNTPQMGTDIASKQGLVHQVCWGRS